MALKSNNKVPYSIAILLVVLFSAISFSGEVRGIICGDTDASGNALNISDVTYFVDWLFGAGPPPAPVAADCNSDGQLDISDLTCFVDYLFLGGTVPVCPSLTHVDSSGPCISAMIWADCTLVVSPSNRSGCLDPPDPGVTPGEIRAAFIGDELHVYHDYAYYNCCLDYATTFDFQSVADTVFVTVTEFDNGEPCYCLCYFDLEAVYLGLNPPVLTTYIVTVTGIDGLPAGADTVKNGPCGYAYAEATDSSVILHHDNAHLNCCPAYYVDWIVDGFDITAVEHDTLPMCDCVCYYNLQSTLENVPTGVYRVATVAGDNIYCPWDTIAVDTVRVGVIGGPCDYREFPGTATVISVVPADAGSNSCINGVVVTFNFTPDDPSAPAFYAFPGWPDAGQHLTVGDGKHPNADWAQIQGLTVGSSHPCKRREIITGACPPVLFEFLDIDYGSYAEYCF